MNPLRILAQCVPAGTDGVQVAVTDDTPVQLWMLNFDSTSREIGPAELFGFNLGSFCDKPQGSLGWQNFDIELRGQEFD